MADVTTLPGLFWPLMDVPSIKLDRCAICGRRWPLNDHHIVWRSQGQLVRDGAVVPKPTITLCGEGNNLYGSDGRGNRVAYCHGKVHHRYIHFRADRGRLEYVELASPCCYDDALAGDGWRDVDPLAAARSAASRPQGAGDPLRADVPAAAFLRPGWERTADGGVLSGEDAMRFLREMFGIAEGR